MISPKIWYLDSPSPQVTGNNFCNDGDFEPPGDLRNYRKIDRRENTTRDSERYYVIDDCSIAVRTTVGTVSAGLTSSNVSNGRLSKSHLFPYLPYEESVIQKLAVADVCRLRPLWDTFPCINHEVVTKNHLNYVNEATIDDITFISVQLQKEEYATQHNISNFV